MKKIILLILCLACGYWSPVRAVPEPQSLSYSSGIGAPNITTTADVLGKGEWGVSQRAEYYVFKPLSDSELLSELITNSQNATFVNFFILNYGLGEHLTIGASLAYTYTSKLREVNFNETMDGFTVVNNGHVSGDGDSNLYSLLQLNKEGKLPFSTALLAGTNTPTGKKTVRDNKGILFSTADQPGNGAWIPYVGFVVTKTYDILSLSGNLIYTRPLKGSQDTTLGALFDYNIAAVSEIYKDKKSRFNIDGILELNGEFADYNKVAIYTDPNSGGSSLFLSPGIRANIKKHISLYFSASIPLSERNHGIQVTTRYNVISGIDCSF